MSNFTRITLTFALAILTPFFARIPGALTHGPDWFWAYFPNIIGVMFLIAFATIPAVILLTLHANFRASGLGYWLGNVAMAAVLFVFHAQLDLAADAQAAIALVIFPFYAAIAAAAGYAAGLALDIFRGRRG